MQMLTKILYIMCAHWRILELHNTYGLKYGVLNCPMMWVISQLQSAIVDKIFAKSREVLFNILLYSL